MKTCAIAVLTVVLVTNVGFSEQPKFETVKSETGRFTVEMPGKRKEQRVEIKKIQTTLNRVVATPSSDMAYVVEYFDLQAADVKGKSVQVILDAYLEGSNKGFEVLTVKNITLESSKSPGREQFLKVKDPKKEIYLRDRVFLKGVRLYTVRMLVLHGAKEELKNAEAERFFNSFEISAIHSP